MSKKRWVIGFLALVAAGLAIIASKVITVDPYFHFHAPYTDAYYYELYNPRSQNDGIAKNFDYEGIVTGSSMTQNFKPSEADALFGAHFVKLSVSGATYYEINRNLAVAAQHNPKLKYVIRGVDMDYFFEEKDKLRMDLGTYPEYLYDENCFNDVEYVFNRDVLFSRVYPMTKENDAPDFRGGITSFDDYSYWMPLYRFGPKTVLPNGNTVLPAEEQVELTQQDIDTIRANVQQNLTALAEQYPNITFYYFFPPYSAVWWQNALAKGQLDRQIDAERIVIEEILKYDNIKLFSFNCLFDLTTDLNNYKDMTHYGAWINSLMIRCMYDGRYRLTAENYLSHLEETRQFYKKYDYTLLTEREDYENDYYAAALWNREITGAEPYRILEQAALIELSRASIEPNQYQGQNGLVCTGSLARPAGSDVSVSQYLRNEEYIGAKIQLPDVSSYKYLVFCGKKLENHGQIAVRLYDADGSELLAYDESYYNLDDAWHRYVVDISKVNGPCTLVLNGGYIDCTGSEDSSYVFSELILY